MDSETQRKPLGATGTELNGNAASALRIGLPTARHSQDAFDACLFDAFNHL